MDLWLASGALAALVAVPILRTPAALAFLLAGCFLIARHPTAMAALFLRFWYILLLPLFCLFSFLWSQFPAETFRFSLQMGASVAIGIAIAGRMPPRMFCQVLFWLMGATIVLSLGLGTSRDDTGAFLGLYGSKNAMAGAAATFAVVAAGIAISRRTAIWIRATAVAGVVLGLGLVVLAQSVMALAVAPLTLGMLAVAASLHRFQPAARATMAAFSMLTATLAGLLVAMHFDALTLALLETTGKDITLTGRTDLWTLAMEFIAERPLLGVGYQAFWVKGYAPAEAMWFMFGIESRSGFNFHNTYLNNAVEIGIVGVAMQIGNLYGGTVLAGLWAIRTGASEAALLFALNLMVTMASFVEVPIFFQFSLRTVLVVATLVYAIQELKRLRGYTGAQSAIGRG